MKNPTIKITGVGRTWLNYAIFIPRKNGMSESRGSARIGESIEIDLHENDKGGSVGDEE